MQTASQVLVWLAKGGVVAFAWEPGSHDGFVVDCIAGCGETRSLRDHYFENYHGDWNLHDGLERSGHLYPFHGRHRDFLVGPDLFPQVDEEMVCLRRRTVGRASFVWEA